MAKNSEAPTVMKTLSNETRFGIVSVLRRSKTGVRVGDIAERIGASQSLTSHQLAYLEARGLVVAAREGSAKRYALADSPLAKKMLEVVAALEGEARPPRPAAGRAKKKRVAAKKTRAAAPPPAAREEPDASLASKTKSLLKNFFR